MFLYKIELQLPEGKQAHLIVLAATDEKAFSYVESHVQRHYLHMPELQSIAIVEKKRTDPGSGYLIEG
ncbi:DUF3906 family protein [Paenibacillus herberti]|uniref:DUF3906 domain-containing protein n=1 Tax=Paenibacillus herberti TaxID=1619309 RepID=A0A229P3P3_9BACL|nr:DUF3906 family protein [Paenibacillus herberti]OXM16906.1 hypothetical protein CGZ75_09735 [Paenibacillus herberti]SDR98165.1 Protein of unknown function [Paenibacillaceae bacterium GAS479]